MTMPKKLYTPAQRKEKQRERARNYQRKRTLRNRIVRYSCFLIQQGYTVLSESEYERIKKDTKIGYRGWGITMIIALILLVALIIK